MKYNYFLMEDPLKEKERVYKKIRNNIVRILQKMYLATTIFNRLGVAEAVLQTSLLLIN